MSRIYRRVIQIWTCLLVLAPIKVYAAIAAGGALPWDQPLNTLQTDLQGPVAHAVTTAAIIGTGLTWHSVNTAPACARCPRWRSVEPPRSGLRSS